MLATGSGDMDGKRKSGRIGRTWRQKPLLCLALVATVIGPFDCKEPTGGPGAINPPGEEGNVSCEDGVDVIPRDAQTAVGGTVQFTALCGPNGQDDATRQVSWTSSDPSIATIDDQGVATGVAEGETSIRARKAGRQAFATLTVEAASGGGGTFDIVVSGDDSNSNLRLLWLRATVATALLQLLAERGVIDMGDGEGLVEHLTRVSANEVAAPFPQSLNINYYRLNESSPSTGPAGGAATIELSGTAPTGQMPRWGTARRAGASTYPSFVYQSGGPQAAYVVAGDGSISPVTVPNGQDYVTAVALVGEFAWAIQPGGLLFVNQRSANGLTFTGESVQIGTSAAHLSVSPDGEFMASSDPTGKQVHLLQIGTDGVPDSIDSVSGVFPWRSKFGGDPDWANVCLAVADQTQQAIHMFSIDKGSGALQEAPGSPVDVPQLQDADVADTFLVALEPEAVVLHRLDQNCDLDELNRFDTGASSFNLGVEVLF